MRDRAFVDRRAIADCRELVGCRAFGYCQVEVLRIYHLCLECDSVVDGAGMLMTGNSSQGNLTIEVSDLQIL